MNITTMVLLGFLKVGNVDKVVNDFAYVEYISKDKEIEYVILPTTHADCTVKEGDRVYFSNELVLGCL